MEEHLLTFPISRQVELAAIGARVVVGLADIGRIILESGTPGITHVLIDLITIAVDLEESRHGEIDPLRVVVLQGEEILGCILMVLHETELPHALHREKSCRGTLVAHGLVERLEGEEVGTSRLTVLLIHPWVLPHRQFLGAGR